VVPFDRDTSVQIVHLEANLAMKEEILAKTTPPNGKPGRCRPGDELLTFLQDLCQQLCRVIAGADGLRLNVDGPFDPLALLHPE